MRPLSRLLALLAAGYLAAAPLLVRAAPLPVRIGLDAEFGHLTSTSDDAIRMGMLTAIDEINESGGVLRGRPLELVTRDSRSVPARGVDNAAELAAIPDLVAMFTGKFSTVALEESRAVAKLKLPLLDPWAAADDIVAEKPAGTWSFRLSLRDSWAIPAMTAYLQSRGIQRMGVLLVTSSWGRSNEVPLQRHAAAGRQPQVVGTEWYNWGAKTLLPSVQRLRDAGAQAILFVGNEGEGSLLVREMATQPAGSRLPVVSHWGVTGGNFVELAGEAIHAVDFAVVQTFTFEGLDTPRARQVTARAARLFNLKGARDIPSQAGFAHAYDLVHILARAVNLAGSTDRGAVRDALERVTGYQGLVDSFPRPFTPASHEALAPHHVFIGRFTRAGTIARLRP